MHGVSFWPELFGKALAGMDMTFYRQVDEEREFLTRGKQHHLIGMAHFWWTQECQAEVAHRFNGPSNTLSVILRPETRPDSFSKRHLILSERCMPITRET